MKWEKDLETRNIKSEAPGRYLKDELVEIFLHGNIFSQWVTSSIWVNMNYQGISVNKQLIDHEFYRMIHKQKAAVRVSLVIMYIYFSLVVKSCL